MPVQRIPDNAFEILEFDKILQQVRGFCCGTVAAQHALSIEPETHETAIREELECVREAQRILETDGAFVSGSYDDLTEIFGRLPVQGLILESSEILQVRVVLKLIHEIRAYFTSDKRSEFPRLAGISHALSDPGTLLSIISGVFDDNGEVRSDASKTLIRLTKEMQSVSHRCDGVFHQLVRQYADRGWLADTMESIRNDRRVLAVKAEHKRQIRGILHDQSASGKTVLIEPEEVITINNELFDLRADYKAEIRRLLLMVCDELRTHKESLQEDEQVVIALDLVQAKGKLSKMLRGEVPKVEDTSRLCMYRAFHPLLVLRNMKSGRETIPFDLDLHAPNRILLLSGPNAGGKSILMKAVGLLQLMVQSGMPVPVAGNSTFGIFHQFSASLGDHQSLENDLSTYSSKLMEMRACLEHAGERSLVLIDEFGSGTDPRLGGAIAEGILDALCSKKVHGVITTHYSELKVFAYKTRGLVNGAMVFDKEKLSPTYELRVGKPGSSYTFEIAGKSGLPQKVLDYASKRTAGQHLRAMEDLLSDLERQKAKLDKELIQAAQKGSQLDQLVQSYERMQQDLTAQRHRMRLEQKEKDYAHLSQLNRELEATIRNIKEEKDLEAAKEKVKEVKSVRAETRGEIGEIHDNLKKQVQVTQRPFKVGDHVRVHNGSQTGKIERIRKGSASVIMGSLRMELPVSELLHAGEPLEVRDQPSVRTDTQKIDGFDHRLDLRGMRPREAGELLERFMDQALISNVPYVEIVHGKGTGALRKMVEAKLREYPTREISQPRDAQGGSGMTTVSF